jgi:hypothetical protein
MDGSIQIISNTVDVSGVFDQSSHGFEVIGKSLDLFSYFIN